MKRYETPKEIASALARWAPRQISHLLDPAVGPGALIEPFVSRLCRSKSHICCIDTDPDALALAKRRYARNFGRFMTLINDDFLQVDFNNSVPHNLKFDCIVMNPPFAGKRNHHRSATVSVSQKGGNSSDKKLPLEGAFLMRAVQLLKPEGRILAILPSSIISGNTTKWIREYLLDSGRICCVHELPHFTFEKVEARIYLFVFEKSNSEKSIILQNHKLVRPDKVVLTKDSLGKEKRLDYGFQSAYIWFKNLRTVTPEAGWVSLSDYAEVTRGKANSPGGINTAVHTTDYKNGFWWLDRLRSNRIDSKSDKTLVRSDLLVTRVGRRSTDSIGPVVGCGSLDWTDCVIRIRPKKTRLRTNLLFALRCLLVCEEGRSLLQRGSSAKYIVQSDLESLLIPRNLADMCPRIFAKYQAAVSKHHFDKMIELERYVQSMLKKRLARQHESKIM